MNNIPEIKLGIIAVSRDCFPIGLSTQRRKNIVAAYNGPLYECPVTVENELDMQKAVADVKANDCNALVALTKSIHSKRERLIAAKKTALTSFGYPEDYLELHYSCPDCKDTG